GDEARLRRQVGVNALDGHRALEAALRAIEGFEDSPHPAGGEVLQESIFAEELTLAHGALGLADGATEGAGDHPGEHAGEGEREAARDLDLRLKEGQCR